MNKANNDTEHFYNCKTKQAITKLLTKLYKQGYDRLLAGNGNPKQAAEVIWQRYKDENIIHTQTFKIKNYPQYKLLFFGNIEFYIKKYHMDRSEMKVLK